MPTPEYFKKLLLEFRKMAFVHNHPSGSIEPSEEDFAITERLVAVATIMGIDVTDHVIVCRNGHFSFQYEGLLKQ